MPAPKLYNWDTKQWDVVPEQQVTDGVASGKYSFEHGLDIPGVAPDGQLVNIPSQHAQEAFRDLNYRWQTDDDQKAWEAQQNQAIDQEHFGDGGGGVLGHAADAFLAHTAMGGLPGGGFIAHGMASAMGKNPADFDQAYQKMTDLNPKASFAGDLVGAGVNPALGAVGEAGAAVAKGGLEAASLAGAGEVGSLEAGAARSALAARASSIVNDFAPPVVRGVFEGGYMGLHDTVNEAALGDPQEAAENLLSNVGTGLVFGGIGGAAAEGLSKVATPIKDMLSDKLGALSEYSQKAAEKAAQVTVVPTLPEELRPAASELIGNKDLRDIVSASGDSAKDARSAISTMSSQLDSTSAEVKAQAKELMADFDHATKNTPTAIQNEINSAVNAAGADFGQATSEMYNSYMGSRLDLDAQMAADQRPGNFEEFTRPVLWDRTNKLINELKDSGLYVPKQKANELETYVNAQKAVLARDSGQAIDSLDHFSTAGQEQRWAMNLRRIAESTKESMPEELKQSIGRYHSDLTDIMHAQPEYGESVKALDNKYAAYEKLRDFVDKNTGGLKDDVMRRLRVDPEYAHELDALMTHFPDTAPILQNFKKAIEDPLQAQVHLNTLKQTIRDAGADTHGRMGVGDYEKIADMIGNGDLQAKAEQLRRIQSANQESGPISKLAANLQALGRPVPKIFEQLEPHQASLEKLADLMGGVEPTLIERMLTKATRGVIKGSTFGLLAPVIGAAIGHTAIHGPLGVVAGGLASFVGKRLFNPVANIESLTKIQNGIAKGFGRMDRATKVAIDALTSPAVSKVAAAAGPALPSDKRETYQQRQAYLMKLQDPEALMQHAEDRLGSSSVAPNVSAAVHGQYAKTVQFLTSKMPPDPLMHLGLTASSSAYVPSDMDTAKFERYHAAAVDPVSTLNNIAAMRATPQEIETHRTLYPSHFQRLQEGVLDAIMKPDIKLSYPQRIQIGQLFGVPTAVSMRPDFVGAMQTNFNNQAGQGPQSQGIKANPKVAFDPQSQSTEVERITYQ